jgi:hypothetical protein
MDGFTLLIYYVISEHSPLFFDIQPVLFKVVIHKLDSYYQVLENDYHHQEFQNNR